MSSFVLLKDFPLLSFENIRGINGGWQCFCKGYDLVKCGDVFDVNWSLSGVHLHVFGYVHSEKMSSQFYCVDLTISSQSLDFYRCPCRGSSVLPDTKSSALCKHVFAILASLDALCNCAGPEPPTRFKRVGM